MKNPPPAAANSSLKLPPGLSLSINSSNSQSNDKSSPKITSELPSGVQSSPPSPTSTSSSSSPQLPEEGKHRDTVAKVNKKLREYGPKDFEILRYIGRGGIGKVYCVRLKTSKVTNNAGSSEKIFAMKVLDKKEMIGKNKVKRVLTEREILATADHPFIVTLYCSFQTKNKLYYVMEYCAGGDFFRMLQRQPQKCISEKECQFYASEVLSALEYLHYMGFIYRDLKPENILVAESGHIRLTDFDLSKSAYLKKKSKTGGDTPTPIPNSNSNNNLAGIANQNSPSTNAANNNNKSYFSTFLKLFQTSKNPTNNAQQSQMIQQYTTNNAIMQTNSFVGTEEYLAPEVIEGVGHGTAVDWWTFGILIYEMLFGKTPFKGTSQRMTFGNIIMFYKQKKESKGLKLNLPKTTPKGEKLSKNCRNLIRSLLDPDPNTRLGHENDAVDAKNHAFFKGINWGLIGTRKPPLIPKISHAVLENQNFANLNDSESDPLDDSDDDDDSDNEQFSAIHAKTDAAEDAANMPSHLHHQQYPPPDPNLSKNEVLDFKHELTSSNPPTINLAENKPVLSKTASNSNLKANVNLAPISKYNGKEVALINNNTNVNDPFKDFNYVQPKNIYGANMD